MVGDMGNPGEGGVMKGKREKILQGGKDGQIKLQIRFMVG